jgi:hypothetical protein
VPSIDGRAGIALATATKMPRNACQENQSEDASMKALALAISLMGVGCHPFDAPPSQRDRAPTQVLLQSLSPVSLEGYC